MKKPDPEIALLLNLIDEGYRKTAWHGPNMKGSIRGLNADEAAWRPASNRHNIWEVMVHVSYWKYVVRRRILGDKKGSFPLKGSNWFTLPDSLTDKAWRDDKALLEASHRGLVEAIQGLRAGDLSRRARSGRHTNGAIIRGAAFHDIYHAGQIQLIKRMME